MLAMSFHATQNKMPVLPHVIFEGTDIPYNIETKFLGIYINENMKWNNDIKYLSSKLMQSLDERAKRARLFRILAPRDNKTAAMEELQVAIQSLNESFAILSVKEESEIVSNSGTSR